MSERGPAGSWLYFCYWEPGGAVDTERTLAELPASDRDAALFIERERRGTLHYLAHAGEWLIWDGQCHRPDDSDRISRLLLAWSGDYLRALAACRAQDRAEFLRGYDGQPVTAETAVTRHLARWDAKAKYATRTTATAGHNALLAMLAKVCGTADSEFAEQHPGWLNLADCTVSLATGLAKAHDVRDKITYALPYAYKPWLAGQCPQFLAVVSRCAGSPELAGYLLRCLGYGLLGNNPLRKFFLLNGPTNNGKTTILTVVSWLLGPLAHESRRDLIGYTRHGRNARTENSIRGRRLVSIAETSEHMRIEEAQLKRLTGEDETAVDEHYAKREIKTPVTWTIYLGTNELPAIGNFDEAIRERAAIVPCDGPTIPLGERVTGLARAILDTEGEAILATLIAACAEVTARGLQPPAAARVAGDAYRGQQNTVAEFIADLCVMRPERNGSVPPHILRPDAWKRYHDWSGRQPVITRNVFYAALAKEPGVTWNESMRRFEGLVWRDDIPQLHGWPGQ